MGRVGQPPIIEVGPQPRDGIALAAGFDLAARTVALRVTLEVSQEADGARLDQAGPLPGSRTIHRGLHGLVDGERVVAVHGHSGDAVARCACRDAASRGREVVRGGRCPEVVLADEDHRHLPQGGEVDALVKGAAVGGTVAILSSQVASLSISESASAVTGWSTSSSVRSSSSTDASASTR